MYNKLFTSILDSSIWLEEPPTKVVWVTLIAAMDEDGFAHFSAMQNLANRAVLSLDETEAAVKILESPDPNSADKEFDGRRIERVPGGWMVLNAGKYRELATRAIAKEKVRKRVQKYRLKQRIAPKNTKQRNDFVTPPSKISKEEPSAQCYGDATECNASEAEAEAETETNADAETDEELKTEKKDDFQTAGEKARAMQIRCNVPGTLGPDSKEKKIRAGAARERATQ